MRRLLGYKEAYLGVLLAVAFLAFYVSPFFWLAWVVFVIAFLARRYER